MNVFIRAMVRIFSFGERWNVLPHLSAHENILTIARIKTFIICTIFYALITSPNNPPVSSLFKVFKIL